VIQENTRVALFFLAHLQSGHWITMIQDSHSSARIVYEVDGDDRLCALNPAWAEFAEANGATGLIPEQVLGQSLWSFIVGEETATLYRSLLEVLRRTQRPITFHYRCDSPDMRRFMCMTVTATGQRHIVFESVLVRAEQRDRAVHLHYAGIAANPMALRCSMCNRLKFGGVWMDVAEAFRQGEVLNTEIALRIAYTICPSCGDTIKSMCFTSNP
jgi:hypothetical protein